jgi:hypothetical protein
MLLTYKNISEGVAKLAASLKESSDFIKLVSKADVDSIKELPLADQRKLKQEMKSLTKSFSEYTEIVGSLSKTLGMSIKNTQILNAKERPSTTVNARLDKTEALLTELLTIVKGKTDDDNQK